MNIFNCITKPWKKKWDHFDLKSWVIAGTKIRQRIPSNWRIFEWNWIDIESQIDSNILQLLRITGRILVPPVTQLFRSKWLNFFLVRNSSSDAALLCNEECRNNWFIFLSVPVALQTASTHCCYSDKEMKRNIISFANTISLMASIRFISQQSICWKKW